MDGNDDGTDTFTVSEDGDTAGIDA